MAALPPRKNPTPTKIHRQNLNPLETLLYMGFSRQRAEKALVATGHRGVQLASDWLLAHVNDPSIDTPAARDYILYLCPVGELQQQLSLFWQKSKYKMGWNGAHNSFPHITLTSSFKCPDADVLNLMQTVSQVSEHFMEDICSTKILLERYMSPNFFGLFVEKEQEALLKRLTQELCKEIRKLGVKADPIIKSFHLTLAYQFPQKHFTALEDLASHISPHSPCSWELRLYSYDSRTAGCDVYKVLYAHVPREQDELELLIGDFVFVTQEEMSKTTDGWVVGISWLTGASGYLPSNYVERTAETNAWTLHTVIPFSRGREVTSGVETLDTKQVGSDSIAITSINNHGSNSSLERLVGAQECDTRSVHDLEVESLYAKVTRNVRESPAGHGETDVEFEGTISGGEGHREDEVSSSTPTRPQGPRQVFIARHGERVDFTFGLWIPYSFDKDRKYQRKDLNMPPSVPERRDGPEGFTRDCPLTVIGTVQAKMVGEAMKEAGVTIHHVFCSPSLRCIQTCHNILHGLGLAEKLKINIEPGLFEWLAWYQDEMPSWMSAEELISAGYNIEPSYKPYISSEELQDTQETCQQFFIRNFFITQCALQATEEAGGNVLLIGHAATLDTCSRQLVGKEPRPVNELMAIVRKVPYCSVAMLEEVIEDDDASLMQMGGRSSSPTLSRAGRHSPTLSRLGGRSSPGGISSMSLMSRSTIRTPAPPPKVWRIVQPPFPPMTHTSVSTFDWKMLLDKE